MSHNSSSSIQVVVRLRPMNEKEKKHGTVPVVTASTSDRTVTVIRGQGNRTVKSSYSFDNVFTAFSTQEEVFEETLKPVIGDVMKGFESTVFAYGQTGTGKTHTMEGDIAVEENQGVIPRAARAIFESLKQPHYSDHKVYCSYLEIYNEDLSDLLVKRSQQSQGQKLEIMESKEGPFCRGLSEVSVKSAEDVLNLMQEAQQNRRVGETKMNKHSSRSHCIFTLRVNAKATVVEGNGAMGKIDFTGKLHMVDLAGSECAKTASMDRPTGEDAARERERMNINRSLLTLGRVIQMLKERSEGGKRVRIPYRDSKLTRILQESLGGRCKTVVIATLSPSVTAIEESISTLNYAQSANGIVNKPVSSSFMAVGGMPISTAGSSGDSGQDGSGLSVEHWQEMECRLEYMKAQVEEAQGALARKHLQQQELVERAEKAESEKLEIENKLNVANQQILSVKKVLKEEVMRRKEITTELKKIQYLFNKTNAMLKATQTTEIALTKEARSLLDTLQFTISESETLYDCLIKQQSIDFEQKTATKKFLETSIQIIDEELLKSFANLSSEFKSHRQNFGKLTSEITMQHEKSTDQVSSLLLDTTSSISCLLESMKALLDKFSSTLESSDKKVTMTVKGMVDSTESSMIKFEKSCSGLHEKLQQAVDCVTNLSSDHAKSSQLLKNNMEKNVTEAKDLINSMTQSTCNAIDEAKDKRSKLLKEQSAILNEFDQIINSKIKAVLENTCSTKSILNEAQNKFKNAWTHHENMDNMLTNQQKGLIVSGQKHSKLIESQTSNIKDCQEFLQESERSQQEVRNDFMKSVMTDIQNLIESKLVHIEDATKQHFIKAKSITSNIFGANENIQSSTSKFIGNIEQTNKDLSRNLKLAVANDISANQAMIDSVESVCNIKDGLDLVCSDAQKVFTSGVEHIKQLREVDEALSSSMIANVSHLCDQSTHQLSNNILSETNRDLRQNAKLVEMMSHQSKALLLRANDDVDILKSGHIEACNTIQEASVNIKSSVSELTGMHLGHVESQHNISCKIRNTCNLAVTKFSNELSTENKKQLTTITENMVSSLESIDDILSEHTSSCTVSSQNLRENTKNHSLHDIRCDEKPFTLPNKTDLSFSTTFSKTPFEKEVLEKAGVPIEYMPEIENDGCYDDFENVMNKENSYVDANRRLSTESSNSTDNSSIASAGDMAAFNKRTLKQISSNSPSKKRPSPSKRVLQSGNAASTPSKGVSSLPTKKIRRADASPAKQKMIQGKVSRKGYA